MRITSHFKIKFNPTLVKTTMFASVDGGIFGFLKADM